MKGPRIAAVCVVLVALLGISLVLRSNESLSSGAGVVAPGAGGADTNPALNAANDAASDATNTAALHDGMPADVLRAAEPLGEQVKLVTLSGRVTGADGVPLKSAHVVIQRDGRKPLAGEIAVSDADGRYALEFPAKWPFAELRAEAASHAPENAWVANDASGTHPAQLDFVLDALVTLTGRVTWATDGSPCAGANVLVKPVVTEGAGLEADTVACDTTTDADGTFRGEVRGAQLVTVAVTPPDAVGLKPLTTRRVVLLPEAGEHRVELALQRRAIVTVTLHGADPTSVASLPSVVLEPHDAGTEGISEPLENHEATFSPVDPEVSWDVAVFRPGLPPLFVARQLEFPAGKHSHLDFDVDLSLSEAPESEPARGPTMSFRCRFVHETGRVLRADEFSQRAALSGPEMTAEAVSLADGGVGNVFIAMSDSAMSGTASVFGAQPPIAMTLRLGDLTLTASPIANQQTVDLVVAPPRDAATLHITVTDGSGTPRLAARALLIRRDTNIGQVVLPLEGSGDLVATVSPGPWAVSAVVNGLETAPVAVDLAPGDKRSVTLTASAPGMLRGLVDPPPGPGESATVQAMPAAGGIPGMVRRAFVGRDGRFELPGLTAGAWNLACLIEGASDAQPSTVRGPQRVIPVSDVQVPSAGIGEVVIENRPAASCSVTLRASAAPAPYGISVSVAALDGSLRLVQDLWPREQVVLHLPCGRYAWQRLSQTDADPQSPPPKPFELTAETAASNLIIDV